MRTFFVIVIPALNCVFWHSQQMGGGGEPSVSVGMEHGGWGTRTPRLIFLPELFSGNVTFQKENQIIIHILVCHQLSLKVFHIWGKKIKSAPIRRNN